MSETNMTISKNGTLSIDVIKESLTKITEQHKRIGKIETPKGLVKKKQGFDYVELSYMKNMANEQFPGWSWTIIQSEALTYLDTVGISNISFLPIQHPEIAALLGICLLFI